MYDIDGPITYDEVLCGPLQLEVSFDSNQVTFDPTTNYLTIVQSELPDYQLSTEVNFKVWHDSLPYFDWPDWPAVNDTFTFTLEELDCT